MLAASLTLLVPFVGLASDSQTDAFCRGLHALVVKEMRQIVKSTRDRILVEDSDIQLALLQEHVNQSAFEELPRLPVSMSPQMMRMGGKRLAKAIAD